MNAQDTFKDRLLFTFLSAAAVAVVAYVARQAISTAWQRLTGRHAPKPLGLLNPAGKRAGESTAAFLMQRLPVLHFLQP
ncbi:MAG TPA: hypothetical protein VGK67_03530 [Myxococcales bacterium]